MKLAGFSEAWLNLGSAEFSLMDCNNSSTIQSCDHCVTYFTKIMNVLECKHIICDLCCVFDYNEADQSYNSENTAAFCTICRRNSSVTSREVHTGEQIAPCIVSCICGCTFPLRRLKEHLMNSKTCFGKQQKNLDGWCNGDLSEVRLWHQLTAPQDTRSQDEVRQVIRQQARQIESIQESLAVLRSAERASPKHATEDCSDVLEQCSSKMSTIENCIQENLMQFSKLCESLKVQQGLTTQRLEEKLVQLQRTVTNMERSFIKGSTQLCDKVTANEQMIHRAYHTMNKVLRPNPPLSLCFGGIRQLVYNARGSYAKIRARSDLVGCGEVLWYFYLELEVPHEFAAVHDICLRDQGINCSHVTMSIALCPVWNQYKESFPIRKRISIVVLARNQPFAEQVIYTYRNNMYAAESFERYDGKGFVWPLLSNKQLQNLLAWGDEIVLEISMRDINVNG